MTIFEDSHNDIECFPFSSKSTAISEARRVAKELSREYYKEETLDCNEDILFFAQYSYEGNNVRVIVEELDEKIIIE